jgi:hypothetical protein
MDTMHIDDGFDFMAPPTPDADVDVMVSHQPKLVDEHEHTLWWVFPLALSLSGLASAGVVWLVIQALK